MLQMSNTAAQSKPTSIRVEENVLRALVTKIFVDAGMSETDASVTAGALVWADARGVPGHGVKRVERYLEFIRRGDLDPKAVVGVQDVAGAALLCSANRAAGPVAMSIAVKEAMSRCRQWGIALALVRGTTHTGAMGQYVETLASGGCIGIAVAAGPANMAYHGASQPSLSTSPLAIAVPSAAMTPILDMATAAISMGKLRSLCESGEELQPGLALDVTGRPTTDPSVAKIPLSLAGPKGSGLSFMFECLTSVLAADPIIAPTLRGGAKSPHRQNALVIAVDVATFRPVEMFGVDVADLISQLKGSPRAQGVEEILAPGERGAATAVRNRKRGIPVSERTWSMLHSLDADDDQRGS